MSKGIIVTDGSCSSKLIRIIKAIDESINSKKIFLASNNNIEIFSTSTQSEYWRTLGRIYGYNSCCIDEYISDCLHGDIPSKLRRSFNGYVPCSKCSVECNENELIQRGNRGNRLKKLIFINNNLLEV